MGNYITQADIESRIGINKLVQLTDDENSYVNTVNMDKAISGAEGLADSYIGKQYSVPLSPCPDVVQEKTLDIVIYNLYKRRMGAPEDVRLDYLDAVKFFKSAAKNEVSLGIDTPEQENSGHSADIESEDRKFSRTKMDGF